MMQHLPKTRAEVMSIWDARRKVQELHHEWRAALRAGRSGLASQKMREISDLRRSVMEKYGIIL